MGAGFTFTATLLFLAHFSREKVKRAPTIKRSFISHEEAAQITATRRKNVLVHSRDLGTRRLTSGNNLSG